MGGEAPQPHRFAVKITNLCPHLFKGQRFCVSFLAVFLRTPEIQSGKNELDFSHLVLKILPGFALCRRAGCPHPAAFPPLFLCKTGIRPQPPLCKGRWRGAAVPEGLSYPVA